MSSAVRSGKSAITSSTDMPDARYQNILHGHSQPPDAWLATAFVGLYRNQGSVVHDLTVHRRGRPVNAPLFFLWGRGSARGVLQSPVPGWAKGRRQILNRDLVRRVPAV